MIPPTSPVHALLAANAKWADAVNRTEPGFFQRSAEGQSPKVRRSLVPTPSYRDTTHRSSGSAALTRASPNPSSQAHVQATSLSTATLQSTSPFSRASRTHPELTRSTPT